MSYYKQTKRASTDDHHCKGDKGDKGDKQPTGPITGLCVAYGDNPRVPKGYYIIDTDLNEGAIIHLEHVYLAYTRDPSEGQPITAIQVAASGSEDDPDCIPPGYTKVDGDLNKGAGGKYIYASYVTGTSNEPVTVISIHAGRHSLVWPPEDYIRVDQDCNDDTGGDYVYLAYKKDVQDTTSQS